eukprot:gene7483-biopygen4553
MSPRLCRRCPRQGQTSEACPRTSPKNPPAWLRREFHWRRRVRTCKDRTLETREGARKNVCNRHHILPLTNDCDHMVQSRANCLSWRGHIAHRQLALDWTIPCVRRGSPRASLGAGCTGILERAAAAVSICPARLAARLVGRRMYRHPGKGSCRRQLPQLAYVRRGSPRASLGAGCTGILERAAAAASWKEQLPQLAYVRRGSPRASLGTGCTGILERAAAAVSICPARLAARLIGRRMYRHPGKGSCR